MLKFGYRKVVQIFSIVLFLGVTRFCDLLNGKDVFGECQLDTYFIYCILLLKNLGNLNLAFH